jgi:hypothetical protein
MITEETNSVGMRTKSITGHEIWVNHSKVWLSRINNGTITSEIKTLMTQTNGMGPRDFIGCFLLIITIKNEMHKKSVPSKVGKDQ